jgi:pimeloyl-ACP methyl ester carboxylesterase
MRCLRWACSAITPSGRLPTACHRRWGLSWTASSVRWRRRVSRTLTLWGWIALELAKRGRARTLVLLSPAGGYERRSPTAVLMAVRLLIENRIVSHGGARLESAVRRPRLRRLLLWGAFARPEQISAYEGLLLLRSFGGAPSFMALLRALGRDGPVAGLEDVSVPVMIAWGTRDRVLPSRYFAARLRDGIPGAEYRELPGLGHVSMVDDPALVADLVLGFRERHRDSAHAVTNARPAAQAGPSS